MIIKPKTLFTTISTPSKIMNSTLRHTSLPRSRVISTSQPGPGSWALDPSMHGFGDGKQQRQTWPRHGAAAIRLGQGPKTPDFWHENFASVPNRSQ